MTIKAPEQSLQEILSELAGMIVEFFFISEKILRSSDFGDNKSTRTQPTRILIRIGRDDNGILQEVKSEFILEKQMALAYIKMEHLLKAPKI